MTNPDTFLLLVTSQSIWKDAGWGIIVFLAALSAIDPAQYEAAAVDGAGRWKRMWHVTLPGLRSVIVLLLILRLGDSRTVGFEQMILQRDAVGAEASEVLDTFVYFQGVVNGDWSFAAAAGLVKGVVAVVLVLVASVAAASCSGVDDDAAPTPATTGAKVRMIGTNRAMMMVLPPWRS